MANLSNLDVRIPVTLREAVDREVDKLAVTMRPMNVSEIVREALVEWIERRTINTARTAHAINSAAAVHSATRRARRAAPR